MNIQNENQKTVETAAYNPFPEPQTIPSGWDISVFASPSQTAPAEKNDTLSENELT
jgi:hypothetical protein